MTDEQVEKVARIIYYETRRFGDRGIWEEPKLLSDQHIMSDQEKRPFVEAARAAIAAMPPALSPELIDKLSKLATYLTEQGEYAAVDLIDTVVERLTPLPAPPAAQDHRP